MNADMKWLDNPEVFRVNQLDAHSDHCYYMDYADMEKSENPLMQSLNGQWEFAFSKNVMDRPENFYEENFDASSFDKIMYLGSLSINSVYGLFLPTVCRWVLPGKADRQVISALRHISVSI